MSERERHILTALASDSDAPTATRAQVLIEWSQGQPRDQIAHATGLRPAQVQQLTRAFAQKRLEIFAPSSIERASRGLAGPTTVEALVQENQVNLNHARFVAGLALQIFDATPTVHQLDAQWRSLLETGALVHNLGSSSHDERHPRAGRNAILAHDLEGFAPRDRDILACMTLFHTKKVKYARDPIFTSLDPEAQRVALVLSAILRIADGLDFSQSESTAITSIQVDSLVTAVVEGPNAETDAARANKKADLWREVLTPPFSTRLADGTLPAPGSQKRPRASPGLRSQEPITRAGRKIIATQFARLRVLEDEVRSGNNADAVHDMRVATRRMRSAFRLLARFYPKKGLKKIRNPLRELAGLLGEVRDLDVRLENLRSYAVTLTLEQQRVLDPLMVDWQTRRAQAQLALVEFLDAEYDGWVNRVEDFIDGKDPKDAPRVADMVPALIWKRYGKVREYEPRIKQATLPMLHRLRIQCKRMRYALEFFAELMGPSSQSLLEPLIAVQDHLGELHDADMATQLIAEFIATRAQQTQYQGLDHSGLEGVMGYLSALKAQTNALQASFPDRWQIIVKPSFRQELAEAVANL